MSSSPEPEFMQSSVDSSDGSEPGDIDGSGNYQENDENGEQTEAQDAFKGYENQFDAERGISDLYGSAPPQPHPNNSAATLLKRKAEDNADSPSKQIRSSSAKPHVNVLDSAQRPRQAKAAEEESPFWPKAALRNSQTKFKRQSLDRAVDAMGGSSKLKELFAIGDAPNSPQTHTSHNTRNTQPFIPENSSHTLDVSSAANEVKEEEDNPFYQTDIRDHEPEIAYQEPRYESDSSDDPDTVTAAQHEENIPDIGGVQGWSPQEEQKPEHPARPPHPLQQQEHQQSFTVYTDHAHNRTHYNAVQKLKQTISDLHVVSLDALMEASSESAQFLDSSAAPFKRLSTVMAEHSRWIETFVRVIDQKKHNEAILPS